MKVQEIEIKRIVVTENHRVNIEKTCLDELMQSIKQHGLLQAIGVVEDKNGKYRLRFGQRRLLACQKLGHKTIRADVVKEIGDEKMLLENLTENIQRSDPSFTEVGRIIHRLTDEMGMDLKQISIRLGITYRKVKQVFDIYSVLPEKYRKKVSFMTPGAGRKRKGDKLPAQVATKIINMKKHHGLDNKDVGKMFDVATEEGLDAVELCSVGDLMSSGMSVEAALENMRLYGTFNFDIVAKHEEISELMDKFGLVSRKHLFKKIIYGEIPPLNKPNFVSTGIVMKKQKKNKSIDKGQYKKIRGELLLMKEDGRLNENQISALKATQGAASTWTEEQCDQLKEIYKRAKEE